MRTTRRPPRAAARAGRPLRWRRRLTLAAGTALGVRRVLAVARDAQDQRQTRLGTWWEGHPRTAHLTAVAALVWTAVYLVWRIGWSWRTANPLTWSLLLSAELFGWWSLGSLTFFSWRIPALATRTPTPGRQVDVYVCTYNEPVDVLRNTLVGCRAMTYPHTTWLLDDGRRPEMAALAASFGVRYLVRPDNSHAKAGNINHALGRTDGELVFVLDADHVPMPDALDVLVGYFDDDHLALVQTPHDFYNQDSVQHYDVGRHEQSVFYEVICPGKDRHGGAFWCGSATLVRREALLEVGGVAVETIAEDFHTTIKLQRKGWTTRYHREAVVQGLAPHDLASYLLQRDRWARGNLAVFCTPESPLRARELRPIQRLSYFASLMSYFAGPARAVILISLALTLWTGAIPMKAAPLVLLSLWLPATLLSFAAASAMSRGHMTLAESTHFELSTMEIYARAAKCIVRPGKTTFKVTPKEGVDDGGMAALRQLRLVIVLAVLLTLGVLVRLVGWVGPDVLPPLPGVAAVVVPLLGLAELRRVLRTLFLVGRHRQRRIGFRFPCDLEGVAATPDGAVGSVRIVDLSTAGAGLVLDRPVDPGTSLTLVASLPSADGAMASCLLELQVSSCRAEGDGRGFRLGTRLVRCGPEDLNHVVEFCHVVVPYERLRGHRPGAAVPTGPVPATVPAAGAEVVPPWPVPAASLREALDTMEADAQPRTQHA